MANYPTAADYAAMDAEMLAAARDNVDRNLGTVLDGRELSAEGIREEVYALAFDAIYDRYAVYGRCSSADAAAIARIVANDY